MYFNKKLIYLIIAIFVLVGIEIMFAHPHEYLPWDTFPGFDVIFGVIATIVLAIIAKVIMNKIVERKPDYYDKAFMPNGCEWLDEAIKRHAGAKEILLLEKLKDWGKCEKEIDDLPGYELEENEKEGGK